LIFVIDSMAQDSNTNLFIMNETLLKQIVEGRDTLAGRMFDHVVTGLILTSIVGFSIETLPDLPPAFRSTLVALEWVVVIIFTLEYFLRVYVADRARTYILSFWGLIDLFAILPFYFSLGLDLRSLRSFRLMRLFKLVRYSKALQRLSRAMVIARDEAILFLFMTMIVLYLSAVGIYYFEHEAQPEKFSSVFHSLWWAVTTLTTVGYGDTFPVTTGGRLFTFLVLMVGLGIVAVPAGLVASSLSKARQFEEEDQKNSTAE